MNRYLIFLLLSFMVFSCKQEESSQGFERWYNERFEKDGYYRDHDLELPPADSLVVYSDEFLIDTIYRSMKGPYQDLKFSIPAEDSLIWLLSYKVEVISSSDSSNNSEFMCHNNLNFGDQLLMPWHHELNYFNLRIFTLTQGSESIQLPKGFAIPVYGAQSFNLNAQVLNHNQYPVNEKVVQKMTIYYYPEKKLKRRMIPLEQRTVFAFKQYAGPAGLYGKAPTDDKYLLRQQYEVTQPQCGVGELANGSKGKNFDLFHDPYGRRFTGHWKIAPESEEDFTIDISSLLQLKKGTRVHYINAHVHPFCQKLSLIDMTSGQNIFESEVYNKEDRIGIDSVKSYHSMTGKAIYPDHNFAIRSHYHNTSSDSLSAMSVMYLYLQM